MNVIYLYLREEFIFKNANTDYIFKLMKHAMYVKDELYRNYFY